MHTHVDTSEEVSKRPPRAPSRGTAAPSRQRDDGQAPGVGEVYLDTFAPPALASTTDTYLQTYAVVRAILEGQAANMAPAAAEAAKDAAASHVEKQFATPAGGQSNE